MNKERPELNGSLIEQEVSGTKRGKIDGSVRRREVGKK